MDRPRYTARPLPPYSYVPRHYPHPVSDPRGHMHGLQHPRPDPMTPERWAESETYLYGIDLFNHGFYWEAHEAWESLWLAAGRRGPTAIWLKALIKLAAALVKLREGSSVGALRHALRVQQLLAELQSIAPDAADRYCGVEVAAAVELTRQVIVVAERGPLPPHPLATLKGCFELNYPS
jgi:predicted metal-dependent hydrolase